MIERLTVKRALEFAIKTEQLGRQLYGQLATKHAEEPELGELFATLVRDEEIHEAQFAALRDRLPASGRGELTDQEEEYLRAVATAEIFYGNNQALDPADKIKTREDALARALNLEKGSLLYYNAMREVLGPSPVLESIIDAEKQHLTGVMKYLFTGAKMRGLIDQQP